MIDPSRRALPGLVLAAGALALPGCSRGDSDGGEDVSATEDLMREHGVLRRILVLYRESAARLRSSEKFDLAPLAQAADLFREFGEDYHERKLEEQHIFPAVQKLGGPAAALVPILLRQHDRGRQATAFIRAQSAGRADAPRLAEVLDGFVRMYEAHTAFEDTILFQAWKKSLSDKQMKAASDQFEDIEKAQFKGDGFDMAVDRVAAIEQALGLGDLDRYTEAPPPA